MKSLEFESIYVGTNVMNIIEFMMSIFKILCNIIGFNLVENTFNINMSY